MHISVAAAHGPQGRTQVSAHRVQQRFAKRKAPGGVANKRGEDISFAQEQSRGDTKRLLPATEKDAAMNFSCAVKAGKFLIKNSGQKHEPEGLYVLVLKRACLIHRAMTDQSAKHFVGLYMSKALVRNEFFESTVFFLDSGEEETKPNVHDQSQGLELGVAFNPELVSNVLMRSGFTSLRTRLSSRCS